MWASFEDAFFSSSDARIVRGYTAAESIERCGMSRSLRCRITGCDVDPCGVCRRCGAASGAGHAWKEAERTRECYRRSVCERCDRERERPDHDWEPTAGGLRCSRCGLAI